MPTHTPQHDDTFYASVMDEIDKTQNSKSTAKSAMLFLGLSIAAFVIAGYLAWDLRFLLFLIPIMFFHELGHFLAMRIFGYKDVKMFFIPLLGAAVSGKNFNVAGWKKVLVFLAGPLPGLILAIPMALAAIFWEVPVLRELTIMNVAINALNLLPIVPLDGGRIMHAMFFCRNAMLDGIFYVAAALTLIAIGSLMGTWFFAILGGFMLISSSTVFKNASIAQSLRTQYGPAIVNEHQDIPLSTAKLIVDQLPTEGELGQPKILATRTLQIFENINARPPGALATIGLTTLYCLGWLLGFVALSILFAAPKGGFVNSLQNAMHKEVEFSVPAGTIEVSNNYNAVQAIREHDWEIMLAQFSQQSLADERYQLLCEDSISVAKAGRTVWMLLGDKTNQAANGQTPEELLKQDAANVNYYRANGYQSFSLELTLPDETIARHIAGQVTLQTQYGALSDAIEPWSVEHKINDDQANARRTLIRLMKIEQDVARDPELVAAYENIGRLEDEDNYEKSLADWTRRSHDLRIERMRDLKSDPKYDAAVIDLYSDPKHLESEAALDETQSNEEYQRLEAKQTAWARSLGEILGRLPADEAGEVSLQDSRYQLSSGFTISEGKRLSIRGVAIDQPFDGLFALLQWLEQQGASDIEVSIIDFGSLLGIGNREVLEVH